MNEITTKDAVIVPITDERSTQSPERNVCEVCELRFETRLYCAEASSAERRRPHRTRSTKIAHRRISIVPIENYICVLPLNGFHDLFTSIFCQHKTCSLAASAASDWAQFIFVENIIRKNISIRAENECSYEMRTCGRKLTHTHARARERRRSKSAEARGERERLSL